jgi:hypothetical protein
MLLAQVSMITHALTSSMFSTMPLACVQHAVTVSCYKTWAHAGRVYKKYAIKVHLFTSTNNFPHIPIHTTEDCNV